MSMNDLRNELIIRITAGLCSNPNYKIKSECDCKNVGFIAAKVADYTLDNSKTCKK